MYHLAAPALALRTEETLPSFPPGCTVDIVHNATLAPCCATVGSAPTSVDGVFGCPYTAAFAPAANQSFGACAMAAGAQSICAAASIQNANAGLPLRLRWNSIPTAVLLAGVVVALVL